MANISPNFVIEKEPSPVTNKNDKVPIVLPMILPDGFDVSGSFAGVKSPTMEQFYNLYLEHSQALGFSVRLGTCRRPNGVLNERYFLCSCEGLHNNGKGGQESVEPNEGDENKSQSKLFPVTRTDCKANIRIKIGEDGMWEVKHHVVKHNHPFTPVQWQHYHRSERKITVEEGEAIKNLTEARLPATVQHRVLSVLSGGDELVGHTKRDHINAINRLKMKAIEGGDAATLINLLSQRQNEDPGFFYRVQFGEDNRLTHIFWRDSMMKEDYKLYHDVVVFDTTYRTNRYNLICGAFVGINNHWSNVMFGCTFLSDEKIESFEWLFNVFNESMNGDVIPTSIFTDQDCAMTTAIEKVYPNSRHRLCQWHIQQNAMSHFGSLKHDRKFQSVFNKCLRGCYSVAEFESTWSKMMTDYELEDDDWFQRLYSKRHKWCTAFSKDFFSAGILSSQRSESTNHAMGFQATKTTSLTEFLSIYEATVRRWRSNEEHNEFQATRIKPTCNHPMVGLIEHAAEVYTFPLFRDFVSEYEKAINSISTPFVIPGNITLYVVYEIGSPTDSAQYVTFDSSDSSVDCSCRNFQESGWLCFHCLRLLLINSVIKILERYISKRWTKYCKSEVWSRLLTSDTRRNGINEASNWRRSTLANFYTLILKSQHDPEARAVVDEVHCMGVDQVKALNTNRTLSQQEQPALPTPQPPGVSSTPILDPKRATTKGRSARKKRQVAKKRKRGDNEASNAEQEVVPYTPLPRLF